MRRCYIFVATCAFMIYVPDVYALKPGPLGFGHTYQENPILQPLHN